MGGALGIAQGQELHARLSAVYLAVGVPKTVVTIALLLTGDPDRRHARHRSRHRVGCLDLLAAGPRTVPQRDRTAFDDAAGDPRGGLRDARAVLR